MFGPEWCTRHDCRGHMKYYLTYTPRRSLIWFYTDTSAAAASLMIIILPSSCTALAIFYHLFIELIKICFITTSQDHLVLEKRIQLQLHLLLRYRSIRRSPRSRMYYIIYGYNNIVPHYKTIYVALSDNDIINILLYTFLIHEYTSPGESLL